MATSKKEVTKYGQLKKTKCFYKQQKPMENLKKGTFLY